MRQIDGTMSFFPFFFFFFFFFFFPRGQHQGHLSNGELISRISCARIIAERAVERKGKKERKEKSHGYRSYSGSEHELRCHSTIKRPKDLLAHPAPLLA